MLDAILPAHARGSESIILESSMNTIPATVLAQSVLSALSAHKNVKTIARFACVITTSNTLESWNQMLKVPEFKALAQRLSVIMRSASEYEAERYSQQLASLQAVGITPEPLAFLMVDKSGNASVADHTGILSARTARLEAQAEKRAKTHADLVESIRAQILSELVTSELETSELETSEPRSKAS